MKTPDGSPVHPVDLHAHSLTSDGRMTPEDVLRRAATSGIRRIVFADHSCVTFDSELLSLAEKLMIEMPFPALEVSTFYEDRRHHILCYGWGVLDESFVKAVAFPNEVKNRRYEAAVDTLRRRGIAIPVFEDILAGADENGNFLHPYKKLGSTTLISRYVAAALDIDAASARTLVEDAGLGTQRRSDDLSDRYLPTLEVIDLALSAEAIPVLAHPLWQWARTPTETVIEDLRELADAGLKGLETCSYHHRTKGEDSELVRAARELGLVRFGGSDFHGNGKTELGVNGLTEEEYALILEFEGLSRPLTADSSSASRGPTLPRR